MKFANRINQTMPALPSHRRILVLWTIVIVFISQLFHCAFTNQPPASTNINPPPQHSHLHVQALHLKPNQPTLSHNHNHHQQHHHQQHAQHQPHQHFPHQQQQQQQLKPVVQLVQANARQLPHLQQLASLGPTPKQQHHQQQQPRFKLVNSNLNTHQSHQQSQLSTFQQPNNMNHNQQQVQFAVLHDAATTMNQDEQHSSSMVDQLSEAGSDPQGVDNFPSPLASNGDKQAERETYEELLSSSAGASPAGNNNQNSNPISSQNHEDLEPLTPIGSSLSNQNQQQYQPSDQEQAGNSRVDRCRELITLLSFRDSMNPQSVGHHLDPAQLDCSKLRQQITEAVVATTQKSQRPMGSNQQQQAANIRQQQSKLATTTTTSTTTFSPPLDSEGTEISSGSSSQEGAPGEFDSGIASYVAPSSSGRSRQPPQQSSSGKHLGQLQLIRADNFTDNLSSGSSSLTSQDSITASSGAPTSNWQPRASAQFVNQMQQLMLQQQIAQYKQRQKLQQQQSPLKLQPVETTTSGPMYPTESNFESMLETETYAPPPTTTTSTTTSTTSTTTTTTTTTPAPVSHRIKPAGGGRRVRPVAGGAQKLTASGRRGSGRAHNPSTTTTTTTTQPDYPEVNCDDPNSEDFDEVECGEYEATTTTAKPRKARRRTTTPKPTTTTTLSPGYQPRPDGRIIDYMADPNFPRELKGADLTNYPFYITVPEKIKFDCKGRHDGYYADIDLHCQIYHHCAIGNRYDFLCPNYTLFDQTTFTCRFINTVDCTGSEKHFDRNNALYLEKDEAKKLEDASSTTPRPPASTPTYTTPNAPIIPFRASSMSSTTTTSTSTTSTTQAPRLQITSRLGYSRPSSLSNSNNMNLALSITPASRSSGSNQQHSEQSSPIDR